MPTYTTHLYRCLFFLLTWAPISGLSAQQTCGVEGGQISLTDGSDSLAICAGDGMADPFEVRLVGATGTSSAWVITDADLNILGLPAAPPFDLEGAGGGTCLVWHLSHDETLTGAAVGQSAADLGGCFELSNPITVERITGSECAANVAFAGAIVFSDGDTDAAICADGTPDPLEVIRDGAARGQNRAFVITDAEGMILGLPANAGPFDLDGAGPGACLIWYLAYADGLEGLAVGENVDALMGTFDLSNALTVDRYEGADCSTQLVNGGSITLADSVSTDTSICVDGNADPLDVVRDGTQVGPNRTFVITDDRNNILAIPGNNGPFDLDGAGPGTCLIWYLVYADGLRGLAMGENLDSLTGNNDLSNPITVIRQEPDGGRVTVANGDTTYTAVAGDVRVPVRFITSATELSYWYIITDADNGILGFADARTTDTLDLSSAPVGTCRIYGWSYRGLDDPIPGEDIATLSDDNCEAVSTDYIEVFRNAAGAGGITLSEVDSSGRIEILNGGTDTVDLSDYWLCNFPTYAQLSTLTVVCGELNLPPGEVVVIMEFAGFAAADAELGLYSTDDFGSTEAIVSYLQWGSAEHERTAVAIAAGLWREGLFFDPPTGNNSLQFFSEESEVADNWITQSNSFCEPNSSTTSTAPPLRTEQVSLYPNPVRNELTLELTDLTSGQTTVELMDLTGHYLDQRVIEQGNGRHTFSFARLPAGTYFLRVTNEGRALTRRVVRF